MHQKQQLTVVFCGKQWNWLPSPLYERYYLTWLVSKTFSNYFKSIFFRNVRPKRFIYKLLVCEGGGVKTALPIYLDVSRRTAQELVQEASYKWISQRMSVVSEIALQKRGCGFPYTFHFPRNSIRSNGQRTMCQQWWWWWRRGSLILHEVLLSRLLFSEHEIRRKLSEGPVSVSWHSYLDTSPVDQCCLLLDSKLSCL